MDSPFTDFMDVASETLTFPSTELELSGPFSNQEDSFENEFVGEEESVTIPESSISNNEWEDIDRQGSQELFNEFYFNPSTGVTDYLDVSAVKGARYKTGVFIPPSFTKSKAVDVVVYLHGMFDDCDKPNGIDSYWNSYSDIRDYFTSAGRNALLIAPTLTKNPQNDSVLLNHSGQFDNFINSCLTELKSKNYIPADSDFDQIILAGHSAGGKPLGIILNSPSKYLGNIVECWGFDCIYAEGWGKNMSNWAKGNKIFYHYWAWSCTASRLDNCPRVNGDKMQASNSSNFKNIAPVGKIHHQQVIENAWLNEINTRPWFSASSKVTPSPSPVITPAPATAPVTGEMAVAYSKMNLSAVGLSFDAFRYAYHGYRMLDQQGQLQNNKILSIADFTQSSKNKRLYILDIANQQLIAQTKVAHGSKSVKPGDPADHATLFSNAKGSNKSSLGFYVTQKTFSMRPHVNKRTGKTYRRGLSLFIEGKEEGFNSNARARAVVIHAAEYVVEGNDSYNGNSWGCPAVAYSVQELVINTIKDGTCFFIYFNDPDYLNRSLLAKDPAQMSQEDFYTESENYEDESEASTNLENETDPPPANILSVPFAPLPPAGSYWPVHTTSSEGRRVSYEQVNGGDVGSPSRKFLANRTTSSGEPRHHVAVDLYGNFNDPIVACDDGTILSFGHFYTTKTGHDTNSLVVQHSNVIINYGEVGPSSLGRLNLHVGDKVRAGQIIGFIGASGMLHFETYKISENPKDIPPHRWMKTDAAPPASLYNPTKYLLYLRQYGLELAGGSTTSPVSSATPTTGTTIQSWDNAIRLNRYYSDKLGWKEFYEQINDYLLPYSGLEKADLAEDLFAQAVSIWQKSQGFAAKDCDGVIGPATWKRLSPLLPRAAPAANPSPVISISPNSFESVPQVFSGDKVPPGFRQGSYSGWYGLDRKSTMRVDEAARKINTIIPLRNYGITETDIDTFQRLANAETGGRLQNFYSLDMAIVSIGFRQFTFIHGNIHNWIEKAPAAFKRYGIEIDYSLPPYVIKRSKGNYSVKRIKGVDDPETLRWNGWAQRFYYAGLDYEIILAEFLLAKEYFEKELGRLRSYLKNDTNYSKFTSYYSQDAHVRSFFHELNNAAPAYVPSLTAKALANVSTGEGTTRFLDIYLQTAKENWPDPSQVQRIFDNTTAGATTKVFENEFIYNESEEEENPSYNNESDYSEQVRYNSANAVSFPEPEVENFTLAQKIDMVRTWKDLLLYKIPDEIVDKLTKRHMSVQYAHNESYSNDLNTDFYSLRILQYPTYNGVLLDAESLIRLIRLNINSFVDTDYCDFNPYNSSIDDPIWKSKDPVGAVLKLDIKGPDNASVVVSWAGRYGWQFSTVTAPDTGRHPVSGNREFYIITKPSDGKEPFFAIKGLDMMSTGIAGLGLPILGSWGFSQADALWKSMITRVADFINSNSGKAVKDVVYSERVEWRFVYRDYKYLLEQTFGKGAGSGENSTFITFESSAPHLNSWSN